MVYFVVWFKKKKETVMKVNLAESHLSWFYNFFLNILVFLANITRGKYLFIYFPHGSVTIPTKWFAWNTICYETISWEIIFPIILNENAVISSEKVSNTLVTKTVSYSWVKIFFFASYFPRSNPPAILVRNIYFFRQTIGVLPRDTSVQIKALFVLVM